ncbi:MAG TPA: glycosyltransferase family 9 protein, partial [Pseudolabrys sp.]|nr:glycosyltransferase family 9 protein [Pseudolabrys sp.]
MTRIDLPPRPRILVIALRRLGDVLLTTPLIRSLRHAWPDATINALVFSDTAGILEGNPDLNGIVTMTASPSASESLTTALGLWRRYDLAISTQSGDRPSGFAVLAGRKRVGVVEASVNGSIKRALLQRSRVVERGVHRVEEMLRLADLVGVPRLSEVVPPPASANDDLPHGNYAVIHAAPKFRYKEWTKIGWRKIAAALAERGLSVIVTGSSDERERRYLDEVWDGMSVRRADGRLSWPQLTGLLKKARIYIGPDTSVTHLAAAAGCATVALYGPTDPR